MVTVSSDDAGYYNTSRNVGKCGRYFYFVNSEQKLVQIDTDKVDQNRNNPSAWETVVAGTWDGKVEDFVIRKSMVTTVDDQPKNMPRNNVEVDIAILTKEKGTVYEITFNGENKSVMRNQEIKIDGLGDLMAAVNVVSYWNNIIEIDMPDNKTSYIVNGYSSSNNNNRNICISLAAKSFVEIKSQSKLDLNR